MRGALTISRVPSQRTFSSIAVKSCEMAERWLTDGTGTQAGSLFHKAVQIRHLLVQGTECGVFVLYRFDSQPVLVLGMLAEVVDAILRYL